MKNSPQNVLFQEFSFITFAGLVFYIFNLWFKSPEIYDFWNTKALGIFSDIDLDIKNYLINLSLLNFLFLRHNFYKSIFCSFTSSILIYFWFLPLATLSSFLKIDFDFSFLLSFFCTWIVLEICNLKPLDSSINLKISDTFLIFFYWIFFIYALFYCFSPFSELKNLIQFGIWDTRDLLADKLPGNIYYMNNIICLALCPLLNMCLPYNKNGKFYFFIGNISSFLMFISTSHRSYLVIPLLAFFLFYNKKSYQEIKLHIKKIAFLYFFGLICILKFHHFLIEKELVEANSNLNIFFLNLTGLLVWRNLFTYPFTFLAQIEFVNKGQLTNASKATQEAYFLTHNMDGWLSANFIPEALIRGGFPRLIILVLLIALLMRLFLQTQNKKIISFNIIICSFFFLFISIASYFMSALLSNGYLFLFLFSGALLVFEITKNKIFFKKTNNFSEQFKKN